MSSENIANSNLFLDNLIIAANVIELGNKVIADIAGNDISTRVDNSDLNKALRSLLAAKLNQRLIHYKKGE